MSDLVCGFLSTELHDPASMIIRWGTHCDYSHIGWMRFSDQWTFSAMNDSTGVGWRRPNTRSKIILISVPKMQEAFEWALTQEGKPYDIRDILGFVVSKNWGDHDMKAWICSELFAYSFAAIGSPLFSFNTPLWHISPRDNLLPTSVKVLPGGQSDQSIA